MPTDALRRSVTRDDYATNPRQGVFHLLGPTLNRGSRLPDYWEPKRDLVLRSSVRREAMWGSTIYIALTKLASWSWELSGDVPLRVRRFQRILIESEGGRGWVNFMMKVGRDFLTTDNGSFYEQVHSTGAPGSRLMGLFHLDSCRCTRTGDPDEPVIYTDKKGREHVLKSHEVTSFSDMPDPGDTLNGVGYCAASRAWPAIVSTEAIEQYLYDKVSGNRPLAIYITDAVTDSQLEEALITAQAQASAKGGRRFMGAVFIAQIGDVGQKNLLTIPLAELPDAFDPREQRRHYQLTYAVAVGLDPQDINPDLLASRPLGSGAQSQVIDDKASGHGLSAFRQAFTHGINENVVDTSTTFYFSERDYRDQGLKADVAMKRANYVNSIVSSGIITMEEGRQLLVDLKELPKEFLPTDITPEVSLSDTEKSTLKLTLSYDPKGKAA